MATITSTVPAFLDALKALLSARAGLTGVTVATAPTGDPIPTESIQFFGLAEDQEWGAIGHKRRNESYTVQGGIFVIRRGAGEAKAKEVRDRAYAILAELEDAIRVDPGVSASVRQCELTQAVLDQGGEDNGRWAALQISIGVKAELRS